jgi:hypothetical protein
VSGPSSSCVSDEVLDSDTEKLKTRRKERENVKSSNGKTKVQTSGFAAPCPGHISFEFRTRKSDGLLVYAGPLGGDHSSLGDFLDEVTYDK